MIHLVQPPAPTREALSPAEQHGLAALIDLSRLARVDQPDHSVRVETIAGPSEIDLARCITGTWNFEVSDGVVRIPRDMLRAVTEIIGAAAEQRSGRRDRYGRVHADDNALVRLGAHDEPVISRAAASLRQAVARAAARRPVLLVRPWPDDRRWAVALTHDLDVVSWWPGFTALRAVELIKKGRLGLTARVGAGAIAALGRNPVERAAESVLALESRRGVPSTWFVLCGSPTFASMAAGDLTYKPESKRARNILAQVENARNEVGLHGSFASYQDAAVFREQRSRLAALVSAPAMGVRQHFLRMVPGSTQRAMENAGFGYDSTFGFADRNGFRLGVADIVPVWDESRQQTLAIDEAPFTWMDRALSKYQGIEDPRVWIEDGLRIAQRVRDAEGLWVGIWHPNLDTPLGYPDALAGFDRLLEGLAEHQPHFTTVGNAVRWRRARRDARIRGLRADGVAELQASSAEVDIRLEALDGSPTPVSRIAL